MKKLTAAFILTVVITVTGVIVLFVLFAKYKSAQEQVEALRIENSALKSDLDDAKGKITELEDNLDEVQHFDDAASVAKGFEFGATNFTGEVIETQIDGEFNGWSGNTVFKMMDGSIWQQVEYAYEYEYAYMPDVIIYRKDGTYYMKVEDVEDELEVRQIR